MTITTRTLLVAAAITLTGGFATTIHAQSNNNAGPVLEEIVVTARKVEESLQDVPLAITAFTAEQIQSAAIENLDDVANFTPGLTFSNLIGEFLPVPVIRGVAPTDIFGENNAAIFVDGIFVSGREGLNFSQLDLERIEVVKGPQSAMYGRSSFSGAINFVTARPTNEFQGNAEAVFGDDGRLKGLVRVSGPIVKDKLYGRIAISHDEWDGSYTNQEAGGPDIGGYEFDSVQGSLLWTPTDKFEAGLSLYVSDDQPGAPAMNTVAANCEDRSVLDMGFSRPQNFCGKIPSVGTNDLFVIAGADGEDRDLVRTNLKMTLDTDVGQFTANTGFSNVRQNFSIDGSRGRGSNVPWVYPSFGTFFGPLGTPQAVFTSGLLQQGKEDDVTKEFSQELRWTSDPARETRYSAGFYYYDVNAKGYNDTLFAIGPLPFDMIGLCPCINIPAGPPGFGINIPIGDGAYLPWFQHPNGLAEGDYGKLVVDSNTKAWSIFGFVEHDFNDRYTGRIEARFSDEDKDFVNPLSSVNGADNWDFTTWRASLDFKANADTLWYGSISKGSKSGGFDTVSDGAGGVVVGRFQPEENITYEIGYKGTLMGGRVSLDAAVYYIDWSEIVVPQVVEAVNGVPLQIPGALSTNAGDASVTGFEANLQAALTDNLLFSGGLSYTDSEFDNASLSTFQTLPTFAPDGDISGRKLLRQSKWQYNASLTWTQQLRNDWGFYTRGDVMFQDDQFVGAANQAIVPARTLVNLRIGFDNDRYTIELWSENLFDEDAPTAAFREVFFNNTPDGIASDPGDFFPWDLAVSHPRRRTIGVTGRMRF